MFKKSILVALATTLSFASILPAAAQIDQTARGLAVGANQASQALYSGVMGSRTMSMDERCSREGRPWAMQGISPSGGVAVATGAVNVSIAATTTQPGPGYVVYLDSVDGDVYPTTTTTAYANAQILVNQDINNRFPPPVFKNLIVPPNGRDIPSIKIGRVLKRYEVINGTVGLSIRNNGTAGTVTFAGSINGTGCALTDDPNWTAPRILRVEGDSTCAGSSGATTQGMWEYQARDYIRNVLNKDIRMILKCNSGSNSTEHALWDSNGYYDVGSTVAIDLWRLGINDAAQGVSATTVTGNMTKFYNKHRKLLPTDDIWFFGPTPLLDTTYEANAAAIRTGMQAQVATWALTDKRVHYCNLGTAWTPTDASKTSDGIHYPTDSTEALVWGVVKACFEAPGGINVQ